MIFNWRDIKNPAAGGAERYIHELAKRLAIGNKVTLFTPEFKGCKNKEIIDGVKVVRKGGKYTVYLEALKMYQKEFKGKYDLVIDSINTVPFFTPFFVKEPRLTIFYQMSKEFWLKSFVFPFNIFGYLIEPLYLRVYKKEKVVTISESSKKDLEDLGFQNIEIVNPGIDFKPSGKNLKKEENLTLISFSRLVNPKRIDHVIKAFEIINKNIPKSKLWILSDGPGKVDLEGLVKELGLEKNVEFFGFVDEKKKMELIQRSHYHLFTSVREGWGIVVVEAALNGTPTIGYDVPGIRDSVSKMGGFLIDEGYEELANKVIELSEKDT
ncbi:MAG: glycosyltransferase, partial [Candidatus Aenigmarchaeota archaeon]|nr:glycosyltransferase [Candidatus Aenigmarchaeota archaeon]